MSEAPKRPVTVPRVEPDPEPRAKSLWLGEPTPSASSIKVSAEESTAPPVTEVAAVSMDVQFAPETIALLEACAEVGQRENWIQRIERWQRLRALYDAAWVADIHFPDLVRKLLGRRGRPGSERTYAAFVERCTGIDSETVRQDTRMVGRLVEDVRHALLAHPLGSEKAAVQRISVLPASEQAPFMAKLAAMPVSEMLDLLKPKRVERRKRRALKGAKIANANHGPLPPAPSEPSPKDVRDDDDGSEPFEPDPGDPNVPPPRSGGMGKTASTDNERKPPPKSDLKTVLEVPVLFDGHFATGVGDGAAYRLRLDRSEAPLRGQLTVVTGTHRSLVRFLEDTDATVERLDAAIAVLAPEIEKARSENDTRRAESLHRNVADTVAEAEDATTP